MSASFDYERLAQLIHQNFRDKPPALRMAVAASVSKVSKQMPIEIVVTTASGSSTRASSPEPLNLEWLPDSWLTARWSINKCTSHSRLVSFLIEDLNEALAKVQLDARLMTQEALQTLLERQTLTLTDDFDLLVDGVSLVTIPLQVFVPRLQYSCQLNGLQLGDLFGEAFVTDMARKARSNRSWRDDPPLL